MHSGCSVWKRKNDKFLKSWLSLSQQMIMLNKEKKNTSFGKFTSSLSNWLTYSNVTFLFSDALKHQVYEVESRNSIATLWEIVKNVHRDSKQFLPRIRMIPLTVLMILSLYKAKFNLEHSMSVFYIEDYVFIWHTY